MLLDGEVVSAGTSNSNDVGKIIGGVVGGVVGFFLLIVLPISIYLTVRRRRDSAKTAGRKLSGPGSFNSFRCAGCCVRSA